MSDDPKMLKVDDKWSVSYDAGQNDRPLAWHRYGNLHTPFSEFNADIAMFYGLKDATDRIEELEAERNEADVAALERILKERGRVFDAMVDAAEDAAGKDVSFNVVVGRAIRAALAELKGEQP